MAMRILMTGATGFVGRAVVLRLGRERHEITAWVRDAANAQALVGADVRLIEASGGQAALTEAVQNADAVINLAGEPIAGGRWTAKRRQRIEQSRIGLTNQLVDALAAATRRPAILISASAVGYYGDRGDDLLDESSPPGTGFMAEICAAWEGAALRAETLGVRVLRMRQGVVLGLGGGFLERLLPMARRGLGGPLGSGRQFLPWIHIDDLVDVICHALVDPRLEGAIDLVAPQPVRMREMMQALGRATGRGTLPAVPAILLRAALGQSADVVLGSQRLAGEKLRACGHQVRFADLDEALEDLIGKVNAVDIRSLASGEGPGTSDSGSHAYLQDRPPRFVLRSRVVLDAPIDEVFDFFSRPQNLGLLTPATMSFRITSAPDVVQEGSTIDYTLRIAGTPLRWQTKIERWDPGRGFVDSQRHGPYRSWWHEHHFTAESGHTVMEDRVYFALPLGVLGTMAQSWFVAGQLRSVFGFRSQAVAQRFHAIMGTVG
jgi:uncharacterized protein (TIGR01777 family)